MGVVEWSSHALRRLRACHPFSLGIMTRRANFVIRDGVGPYFYAGNRCRMNASSPSCSSCGSWWRLPLLLALVLAAIWLLRDRGIRESSSESNVAARSAPAVSTGNESVSLTIDFGDGRRTEFKPIAWREGMSVRDLTRETPRPARKLEVQGSGESAFLASLDGVANEGADGRNWTYTVNGERGDRSFAIYGLRPGDRVVWTFGSQDESVK